MKVLAHSASRLINAGRSMVTSVVTRVRRIQRGRLLTVAILATGGLAGTLLIATANTTTVAEPEEHAWPVSTQPVALANISPTLSTYGKVESTHVARLRPPIDAPVAEVLVREGQWVKAGDLLIRLDDREVVLALAEREAETAQAAAQLAATRNELNAGQRNEKQHAELARVARDKLKRYEGLFAKGMVPAALLDEVRQQAAEAEIALTDHQTRLANLPHRIAEHEAILKRAKAQRDRARVDLNETEIRAPFSGPILRVQAAPGDRGALEPLLELADASGIEVRASISDTHAPQLQRALAQGMTVRGRVLLDGESVDLDVRRVASDIKAGQGAVDAFLGSVSDRTLPIGRVLEVQLTLPAEHNVVAVPLQSVYDNERVYLVERSRLVPVQVERVGDRLTADGNYQVLVRANELTAGKVLITTQLPRAVAGLLVDPTG